MLIVNDVHILASSVTVLEGATVPLDPPQGSYVTAAVLYNKSRIYITTATTSKSSSAARVSRQGVAMETTKCELWTGGVRLHLKRKQQ